MTQTVRGLAPWMIVALGGVVAGAIDITYAWLFWFVKAGVAPRRIFQSVAAGLLGREAAVAGGWPTAALGLLLHFFIAVTVAFVFYAAARYAPALWRRPWIWGPLYGVAVYGVMTYVVVPLSRAGGGGGRPDALWITLSIAIHAFGIGLPVALAARAALRSSALHTAAPKPGRGAPAGGPAAEYT
jgi:hypothetical protein